MPISLGAREMNVCSTHGKQLPILHIFRSHIYSTPLVQLTVVTVTYKRRILIKFVIGHGRVAGAKRHRGHSKGELDPSGSRDHGRVGGLPPPTTGRRQRAAEGCELYLFVKFKRTAFCKGLN